MAVGVLRVRRLAGRAHGEEREHTRGQIQQRMDGLADDAEAAGQQSDDQLARDYRHANDDGAESDKLRPPS